MRMPALVRACTHTSTCTNACTTAYMYAHKDGYFHTGDIGEMRDEHHVKVIDRKKNIFKLANGEWVSPENVEAAFIGCPSVSQIFVHGTSAHSHVVAVVVPSRTRASEASVIAELTAAAAQSSLRHFERPLAVHVLRSDEEGFTVANGGLTQTAKLCRWKLRARFASEIRDL